MKRNDSAKQIVDDNKQKEIKPFDRRHDNYYLGDWERTIPYKDTGLAEDDLDEPHLKRKHVMLEKYPEIVTLFGIEHSTKYITLFCVACQLSLAYLFGRVYPDSTWVMLITAYFVGGSFTQVFGTIIHEACHSLLFETLFMNRIAGLVANIGIVFPIAASFRRYHLFHHAYQGVKDKDPDLPLEWEYRLVKGNAFFKFLFLFFYPMMYVVRGAVMGKRPGFWEYVNWVWTISFDALIVYVCGWGGFVYLFWSLWLGYGIHPAAAHFIQEHYSFGDGQETYSYYGNLNVPFMNIGYHNEHHDFTKISWRRLPELRAMAPEFYNNMEYHMSWVKVLYNFVVDPTVGPQSRVLRTDETHKLGRKMIRDVRNNVESDTTTTRKSARLNKRTATVGNDQSE